VRISASIGVACFPVDAQSPEALLAKADEAMHHSKKTGRTGVSFSESTRRSFAQTALPKTLLPIEDANEVWRSRSTSCTSLRCCCVTLRRRRVRAMAAKHAAEQKGNRFVARSRLDIDVVSYVPSHIHEVVSLREAPRAINFNKNVVVASGGDDL
jgi:hypothetical protein